MTTQTTRIALMFAAVITALLTIAITYPAYVVVFHNMWRPSVEGSFAGYIEYVLMLFVVPLVLMAGCGKAGFALMVRCKILDLFIVFLIVIAAEFIGKTAGLMFNEFGQNLLAYTPRMAKMAGSGISAGIGGGLLFGILAGAKSNWCAAARSSA